MLEFVTIQFVNNVRQVVGLVLSRRSCLFCFRTNDAQSACYSVSSLYIEHK